MGLSEGRLDPEHAGQCLIHQVARREYSSRSNSNDPPALVGRWVCSRRWCLGVFCTPGGGVSCGHSGGESAPLREILVASASALAAGGHCGLAVLRRWRRRIGKGSGFPDNGETADPEIL